MQPDLTDVRVSIIRPQERGIAYALAEIWHHRALYYWLTWRDIKVRYKQTWIGVCWALLQPLATVLVFTWAFGVIIKVPTDNVPYPLFVLTGLVVWNLFASIVQAMSTSLSANRGLVSKVYFPKFVLLLSAAGIPMMDFAVMFVVVLATGFYYGFVPDIRILYLVPILLTLLVFAVGVGLWCAILNTRYPDTKFVVPVMLQIGVFATPVVYPLTLVGPTLRTYLLANPMVPIVEGFRWAVLGDGTFAFWTLGISLLFGLFFLISAFVVFERHERDLVDAL